MASCYSYLSPAMRLPFILSRMLSTSHTGTRCILSTYNSNVHVPMTNSLVMTTAKNSRSISHKPWAVSCGKTTTGLMFALQRQMLKASSNSSQSCRGYAKKGKSKGDKGHKKMALTGEQLDGLVNMEKVEHDFNHILDDLKQKFIHQLSVRTSQGAFDQLKVKTPDGSFPLIQLGQVIQKSPQLLTIDMAPNPQYIIQVKQALTDSGLNVNPQQDGTSIFIALPKVTREHRENLAKNAKMVSEQSKKTIREIYSKYSRKIKGSKEGHSADDIVAADDMVKDLMHSVIHQIEEMTTAKQKELLGGK